MPRCGSQCAICNLPIRFDTYQGCSHACQYCFVNRKRDISQVKTDESVSSLINFIKGSRSYETRWCDWNIPIHWGGCSDPFQPVEKLRKRSLECLEVFAKTKYPFVVSTKSILPTQEPYYSLFKQCNCVFQVSAVCSHLDKIERGAATFEQRLEMCRKMSKIVPRVVVRCQPYFPQYHEDIKNNIKRFAEAGVYGIVFEAIKYFKKVNPSLIRSGGDFVYPVEYLQKLFTELKEECHKNGIKFFSGENRLRGMGDSLTCCGCEGLEGFRVNHYNLNQYLYDKDKFVKTPAMEKVGTAGCFKTLNQTTVAGGFLKKHSFADLMDILRKDKSTLQTMLPVKIK